MWWISAFLVGLIGSFHCVGMCGPLVLALPTTETGFIFGRILYTTGRLLTYAALGILAGSFGHVLATSGLQRVVSISAGVVVLIMAVWPWIIKNHVVTQTGLYRFTGALKSMLRGFYGQQSRMTLFLIGAVNGLLPCGFVYLAIVSASTSPRIMEGALYMLLFGLGTVPMMFLLSFIRTWAGPKTRTRIAYLTPYISIVVAAILIYRGWYVEPASCCRPH